MVAGLAFLSKKSFNPKNLSNQKQVWEARQQKANDEKKARERAQQLRREKDEEELAFARDGTRGATQSSLKFMYDLPPGLKQQQQDNEGKKPAASPNAHAKANISAVETTTGSDQLDLTKRQAGDDEAAAAFRQMLAAAATSQSSDDAATGSEEVTSGSGNPSSSFAFSNSSGAALQGTTVEGDKSKKVHMSELEKAVGKRTTGGMTLEEQIARFPQLKDAPMAKGMTATNVHVSFKPLGTQLRNVRCLACGVWGHSRGDRECQVSGWDPFGTSGTPPTARASRDGGGLKRRPDEQQPGVELDGKRKGNERRDERRRKKKSKRKRRYSSDSSTSDSDSSLSSEEEQRRRRRRKKEKKRRRREERRSRRRDRSPESERRRQHRFSRRYDSDCS